MGSISVASRVRVRDTETGIQIRTCQATVSRNCLGIGTTSHVAATDFERTFVCWFGVGVGNVLCAGHFADANTFSGDLCSQPEKSYDQITEALQSSSACDANVTSTVGEQVDVHALSTSQEQSLNILGFTCCCCSCNVLGLAG